MGMNSRFKTAAIVYALVIVAFIGFFEFGAMNAQATPVSGVIGTDTTWDLAGSPWFVVGDVLVSSSANLTIEAGVQVRFDDSFGLTVNGNLTAKGTTANPITFTSNSTLPGAGSWYAIRINSVGHAELEYCNIMYALQGVNLDGTSNNNITYCNLQFNYQGIKLTSSSFNNITNNNVSSNEEGIRLIDSNHNNISYNNVTDNTKFPGTGGWGMHFSMSSNNTITGNNVSNNEEIGIYFTTSSDNNTISDNIIGNNEIWDMTLIYSSNANITNNTFINDGIHLLGDELSHFNTHTIPINNKVNGKPIYYHKDCSGLDIDGIQVGQLFLVNCTGANVRNLRINHTFTGIGIAYSTNVNLTGNNITEVVGSIYVYFSSNINITRNNISFSDMDGIFCHLSSNIRITDNNVSDNQEGIFLWDSSDSTITGNLIKDNFYGIWLWISTNNRIYHNRLIDNNVQAKDDMASNFWNDTYPSGGNYWSEHDNCLDLYNGPITQQIRGSPDGICDYRYAVDFNAFDYYPLTDPNNKTADVTSGTVYGRVINEDLFFLYFATVSLRNSSNALINQTYSKFDGFFELNDVPLGNYTLIVYLPGYRANDTVKVNLTAALPNVDVGNITLSVVTGRIEITSPSANTEILIGPGMTVLGYVYSDDGFPLEGISVQVSLVNPDGVTIAMGTGTTTYSGSFSADLPFPFDVAPGDYKICATATLGIFTVECVEVTLYEGGSPAVWLVMVLMIIVIVVLVLVVSIIAAAAGKAKKPGGYDPTRPRDYDSTRSWDYESYKPRDYRDYSSDDFNPYKSKPPPPPKP
jgi:parallel beta-helix repeat protein